MKPKRNPLMRDVFKTAGLFAHYIQRNDNFIMSDFTAYAKNKGLIGKRVNSHIAALVKGFKWAGLLIKTNEYRQASSDVPASPVWKKKGLSNETN